MEKLNCSCIKVITDIAENGIKNISNYAIQNGVISSNRCKPQVFALLLVSVFGISHGVFGLFVHHTGLTPIFNLKITKHTITYGTE